MHLLAVSQVYSLSSAARHMTNYGQRWTSGIHRGISTFNAYVRNNQVSLRDPSGYQELAIPWSNQSLAARCNNTARHRLPPRVGVVVRDRAQS
jgi:hypothetical protein